MSVVEMAEYEIGCGQEDSSGWADEISWEIDSKNSGACRNERFVIFNVEQVTSGHVTCKMNRYVG